MRTSGRRLATGPKASHAANLKSANLPAVKLPLRLAFIAVLCTLAAAGQISKPYWQQQADYDIAVTLNDTFNTLQGQLTLTYHNHSPDTLSFLWIHLWPNAYKTDKTAFAEQKLLAGDRSFYFSKPEQKGYINQLQFTHNGTPLALTDHPEHIDIVKLTLDKPLLPGAAIVLNTPFHVQLPYIFSRGGHAGQFYAITQWYPKVAKYDAQGWHPMPYLDAGEFYNDFGNYKVAITLPANYVVAATGTLTNPQEIAWMKQRTQPALKPPPPPAKKDIFKPYRPNIDVTPPSANTRKTLLWQAEQVTDFAWFADKRFLVKHDTTQIAGKTIDIWNYLLPSDEKGWQPSLTFTKRALHFYSQHLGPYPHPQVSVVADPLAYANGMEYPMITLLNDKTGKPEALDLLIAHEVGHNWLQGLLATNERTHGWMDEGFNTWFERRYVQQFHAATQPKGIYNKKVPVDIFPVYLDLLTSQHRDAPVASNAGSIKPNLYYALVYYKAADWLEALARKTGQPVLDSAMRQYFKNWSFKHPQPNDFQKIVEQYYGSKLDDEFAALYNTGNSPAIPAKRPVKLTAFANLTQARQYRYLSIAPIIGFNAYDKALPGLAIHNYQIPQQPLQWVIAPMVGTGSGQLNGYARAGYTWYPNGRFSRAELFAGLAKFTTNSFTGQGDKKIYTGFTKFTPGLTLQFKPTNALSTLTRTIDLRTFIINEQQVKLQSPPPPGDTVFFAIPNGSTTTVIPQLTLNWKNERHLHPWQVSWQTQVIKQMVRTSVTAHYLLHYGSRPQGLAFRLFAGKIWYTAQKTNELRSNHYRYHFTMHAPNGRQDYTYSNPFVNRNQSPELAGRQILMRDGGFKYRSDYSSVVPGLKPTGIDYFDNWLMALNLSADVPDAINPLAILPVNLPLKVFADVGTSASPWQPGSTQQRFLYSVGLHLPLFKVVHIYYPLFQSKVFAEPNSVNDPFRPGGPKWWQRRLTFSIELDKLAPKIADQRLW